MGGVKIKGSERTHFLCAYGSSLVSRRELFDCAGGEQMRSYVGLLWKQLFRRFQGV